mmetsp:Transcript_81000/g.146209  ORF Transcript_81000/g.146209 Transcript_81000/m.146209 type:complete len:221 (-) Transcript_81000:38-700(-)
MAITMFGGMGHTVTHLPRVMALTQSAPTLMACTRSGRRLNATVSVPRTPVVKFNFRSPAEVANSNHDSCWGLPCSPFPSHFTQDFSERVCPSFPGLLPVSLPFGPGPLTLPGLGGEPRVELPFLPEGSSESKAPLECRYSNGRRKSQGLEERWWLEYDPPKSNYISGFGRGAFGGNSIPKKDHPRQMVPIGFKKKWENRERLRFAFRKHGYEVDVPKLGG